jgi:hypothetical protein
VKGLVIEADWEPRPDYPLAPGELERRRARVGSAVWRNPRWSVADRPDPCVLRDDDVLVRNRACGICGSDVHMYETDDDGYVLLPYRMRFPVAIGHEFAGEVVEVGPGVTRVAPGDPIAVEAMSWCGSCRACLQGLFNHCLNGEDHGFTHDGGSAEYVVARERHCWPLSAILERHGEARAYDIGAVIEPTSVSYNGMFLRAGGFLPGQHVAVFGCGPVGLAAVALARAAGAGRVLAVDTQESRRALARKLGADAALDPLALSGAGSSVGDEVVALTGGAGVSMVVEATGAGGAVMRDVERSLALGGKLVLVGVEQGGVPVRTLEHQMKAGSVYGTLGHLGAFEHTIALHAAGRIDMSAMVTARFALDEGVAAIERAAERHDAKVLIHPHQRKALS